MSEENSNSLCAGVNSERVSERGREGGERVGRGGRGGGSVLSVVLEKGEEMVEVGQCVQVERETGAALA